VLEELLAELGVAGGEAEVAAEVEARAAAYLRTGPREAAAQLQLAARRLGHEQLADRLAYHLDLPWSARWMLGHEEEPVAALEATPPAPPVTVSTPLAAACATLSDGRRVAVVGHVNARVGVWDLEAGQPPEEALHDDLYAYAVACVRGLAVTGGPDGRVVVFDLETGRQRHAFVTPYAEPLPGTGSLFLPGDDPPPEGPEPVRAVAAGLTTGGQAVAVSLGDRGWLRRWDLDRGRPLGAVPLGHVGVSAACGDLDGVPVAVAATAQHLAVFDLATGAHVATHQVLGYGLIRALGVVDGTAVALDIEGRLCRWRLTDGSPRGEPAPGHHGDARTIACGRSLAVTGGDDGTVRVWDVDAGRQRHRIPLEELVHTVALADDGSVLVGTTTGIGVLRLEEW